MKKILPIEYPIVTGYPVIANALSILQARQNTKNWILLNLMVPVFLYDEANGKILIDLGGDHTPWNTRYLYDDCPYLTVYRYDRSWFHQQEQDIVSFIKWNIEHERYIYSDVCQKYVSEYHCDDPEKLHDLFIYGYDDSKRIFFGGDFFDKKKYQFITIPFDDYQKAFESVEKQNLPHRIEQTTDIMAIAHRDLFNTWMAVDYEEPKCVLAILKERILECLGKPNVNYMRFFDEKVAYGIHGFDLLQRYFQDKAFYEPQYSYYNCMCIQFLVEHEQVLSEICLHIIQSDQLFKQAETLADTASIIKGLVLKSMFKQTCSDVERKNLLEYLNDLKTQEVSLLKDMLAIIDGKELHKPLI